MDEGSNTLETASRRLRLFASLGDLDGIPKCIPISVTQSHSEALSDTWLDLMMEGLKTTKPLQGLCYKGFVSVHRPGLEPGTN
jgi:hypothetical protein